MKKILFASLLIISVNCIIANDGGYAASAALTPIDIENVSLDYERLFISRNNGNYEIQAELHLNNQSNKTEEYTLGFEYYHDGFDGDVNSPTRFSAHILLVNGHPIKYEYRYDETRNISVLLYKATLKAGMNIIYHNYTIQLGFGMALGHFKYILTTGSRWKGKTIKDIEIFINLTGWISFDTNSLSDFQIAGYGKRNSNSYFLKSGLLYAHLLDFNADKDIEFRASNGNPIYQDGAFAPYVAEYEFVEAMNSLDFYMVVNTYLQIFSSPDYSNYRPGWKEELIKYLKKCDKQQLRVLRNTLYALHGYKFTDSSLQKLFESFLWYFANPNLSLEQIYLSEPESEFMGLIQKIESGK
jgi:hypothetical protein